MPNSAADAPLNGDLSVPATVDTSTMEWSPSPSPSVWRKRVHRVGPAESGQVTSVVRYEPNSRFAPHDHPEGEEILVLEGVFSDEHGDWPAGTYLLNPEGFRHAPFSVEGCVIFVKLRQYPGVNRTQLQLRTEEIPWLPTATPGRRLKEIYSQKGFSDRMRLEQWDPDTAAAERDWPEGVEIFVISGAFEDELGRHGAGCWLRLPPGGRHCAGSREGCELYIKEGGFSYLRPA